MTVQEAIEMLKNLPAEQRKAVLRAFHGEIEGERQEPAALMRPTDERTWQALFALIGIADSDYHDVSSDKYKHLGEAYTTQP